MPSKEPHAEGLLNDPFPYVDKRPVTGDLVCILRAASENRGMQLEAYPSRAVQRGEVHEIAVIDDAGISLGQTVSHISYLGFFEVTQGGVILAGDTLEIAGRSIGQVVGFDLTHAPNHMNIVVRVAKRVTGEELNLIIGQSVIFRFPRATL